MITYSLTEIEKLAEVYQKENNPENYGISLEELPQYGPEYSYPGLLKGIIEEKETPKDSLMEFIGAYDMVVYDEASRNMLIEFLFELPVDDMPMYINDEGNLSWRKKVAYWRLGIGK